MDIPKGHVPPPYAPGSAERLFKSWKRFIAAANYPSGVDHYEPHYQILALQKFWSPPAKVLFLGCGGGMEVKAASNLGYDAWGITLNHNNETYAREKLGLQTVWYGDAHLMPPEWEVTFDGAIGNQFLEHTPAAPLLLVEVLRVLKSGGRAYFETPGPRGWTLGSSLHHFLCPTKEQAHGWLVKAGFNDPVVEEVGPPDAARYLTITGRKP